MGVSANEYVPSDDLVKMAYIATIAARPSEEAEIGDEFDRWLEGHDLKVSARVWDEGAAANWDGQDLRHPNPYRNGDE